MHTYYYEGKLIDTITLNQQESNHAIKVMRSKEGLPVRIINGKGDVGVGEILGAHPKRCKVRITEITHLSREKTSITIAIAPTKSNDRIEFFIEKATEIGVDTIIPLLCKNNERNKINLQRWQKVTLAATKQCQRAWIPEILAPIDVKKLVIQPDLPKTKLIAYCEDLPEQSISEYRDVQTDKIILIGPEGDFTTEEVALATAQGFVPVNLGSNRLRTETAGIIAVSLLVEPN